MIQLNLAEKKITAAKPRTQYAALPWRVRRDVQVLLASSRETRRWVLPKGWPMKGRKPFEVAAIEAEQEAGLIGKIGKKSVGVYHYAKRMPNGASLWCAVGVYPLEVLRQRKNWPERGQRTTQWFDWEEAMKLVHEDELQELIGNFAEAFNWKEI